MVFLWPQEERYTTRTFALFYLLCQWKLGTSTVFNIAKLQCNDRCMTHWICNIKLSDNNSSSSITWKAWDSWHKHKHKNLVINGNRGRGRPKKTQADCVKEDKKKWRMAGMDPYGERLFWKCHKLCNPLDGDLKHVKRAKERKKKIKNWHAKLKIDLTKI